MGGVANFQVLLIYTTSGKKKIEIHTLFCTFSLWVHRYQKSQMENGSHKMAPDRHMEGGCVIAHILLIYLFIGVSVA